MDRRTFFTFGKTQTVKPPLQAVGRNAVQRNSTLTNRQLASRFLAQATLGANLAQIDAVAASGFEAWIDAQISAPRSEILNYMWDVVNPVYQVEDVPLLDVVPFRWAWWQAVMTGQDQLRQRVAMALSEIFVISTRSDSLVDVSTAVGYYYDLLLKHAFGNYRDLLLDVTLSPAMGYYLSHAGNRKSDPSVNRFPDENYAREVMQLFSIGLFELNLDGTRKLDSSGEPIPTYNNDTIKEFAKVFTGLSYQVAPEWEEEDLDPNDPEAFVYLEMWYNNGQLPMVMYEIQHEPGPKYLLNGKVIPSGQTGMQDIEDAINNLFEHPNVGPFMARLLIQRLVKSQPSPSYIARVAGVFNDNGSGVRGDMQAVVKAILLDDEARNTDFINDPTHGMLREPFVRYTQLCRTFEAKNEGGENLFYNDGHYASEQLAQYPFESPSVFNFFSPSFTPLGPLESANVDAPEFQILTSVTAVRTTNYWEEAIFEGLLMTVPEGAESLEERMPTVSEVGLDLTPYMALEGDIAALIDRLDLLLTYGSLSAEMRAILTNAVSSLYAAEDEWEYVTRFAIYLFFNCPEYAILK